MLLAKDVALELLVSIKNTIYNICPNLWDSLPTVFVTISIILFFIWVIWLMICNDGYEGY